MSSQDLFVVKTLAGKVVGKPYRSKAEAKEARRALNLQAGFDEAALSAAKDPKYQDKMNFPHHVSKGKGHFRYNRSSSNGVHA